MEGPESHWRTLDDIAHGIREMRIRGAGRIGRAASEALGDFARVWSGESRDDLISDLREAAIWLASTRPTAISLRNAITLTLKDAAHGDTVEEVRDKVVSSSRDFVSNSLKAVESIADLGSGLIPQGSVVLTHCNSDAALGTIEKAYSSGKVREVICTESRPWRQGHLTARRLAARGIPVTMVVDSAVTHIIGSVDAVVVGADTVTADGSLFNKIGTAQISLSAKHAGIPFIVCAESYKFSPESLDGGEVTIEERGPEEVADPLRPEDFPGVNFLNPVFDRTPPERIGAITTERKVIAPSDCAAFIVEVFGTNEGERDWDPLYLGGRSS